jgi:hypothetical protein
LTATGDSPCLTSVVTVFDASPLFATLGPAFFENP